jgi:hypothetical protein
MHTIVTAVGDASPTVDLNKNVRLGKDIRLGACSEP